MNKGKLYNWHMDIEHMLINGSVLCLFLEHHIKAFYKKYGRQIDQLKAEIKEVQAQYLVMDNGRLKKDEHGKAILLPGKTDAEFTAAWGALMTQPVEKPLELVKPN